MISATLPIDKPLTTFLSIESLWNTTNDSISEEKSDNKLMRNSSGHYFCHEIKWFSASHELTINSRYWLWINNSKKWHVFSGRWAFDWPGDWKSQIGDFPTSNLIILQNTRKYLGGNIIRDLENRDIQQEVEKMPQNWRNVTIQLILSFCAY